ncbi:S-layer homology domain-containing protein [Paenibacillus foliorum]|uniref:S-layer homology domain-containing protein n=1 Tax=Paenibacillus foliorum TaxID=2654974 RepID=UPI0014908D98|nr:S-layer homology domain-containing protein [Paenibacillus foliorum]
MRKKWKKSSLVSLLLSIFIVMNLVAPAYAAGGGAQGGTYFTDDDNWNGDTTGNGVPTASQNNMDVGGNKIKNGDSKYPIDFKITGVDKQMTKSAYLLIRALDVDEYDGSSGTGEWDRVYFSSDPMDIQLGSSYTTKWPAGTPTGDYRKEFKKEAYVGALSGNNETWNTTVLSVDPSKITPGQQNYFVGISTHHYTNATTAFANWVVQVDWGQLVIDGGVRETGEITKGTYELVKGTDGKYKMIVDTGFLPKITGNFAMEVSLIKKVVNPDGTVDEQNLDTATKRFTGATANNVVKPWEDIELGSNLNPNEEYFVNILLFDDRGATTDNNGKAIPIDPGKAQHIYTVSTDSNFIKSGAQYEPTSFTADEFKNKFYKLNGSPNGDNLTKIQIKTLPDPAQGKLVIDDGTNPPTDVTTINQEITIGQLPYLKFKPIGEFTQPVTFKWNGFDTEYALFDANVTIIPNKAPTVDGINKTANKGDTISFVTGDFTGSKFVDPEPDALNNVIFVTLPDPSKGKLVLDNGSGTPVTVATYQSIPAVDLGKLKFIPESGTTGTVTFDWNGSDGIQYAQVPKTVTIQINNPPVVTDITKTGHAGAVIYFSAADFSVAPAYKDTDHDDLAQVKLVIPSNFDTLGKLWYTPVSSSVYTAIAQGSTVTIPKSQLDTLKFQPSASLPNGSTVTFSWNGNDGKVYADSPALVKIAYNGVPVASPLEISAEEGTQPITIVLKGTDLETVTGLVYGIQSNPAKGTLVKATVNNPDGDKWIYTPNPAFTGTDSFTYTVKDSDGQTSQPATVKIEVNKSLDGWAGNKNQGDPNVVKVIPGQLLQLSAVSSLQAAEVTATVNGKPVVLTLLNPATAISDGFKKWGTATYKLPEATTPGEYTVSFTAAAADHTVLPAEPGAKLADNKFQAAEPAVLKLKADPEKILGDGKSTTKLTAVLTDVQGNPIANSEVVFSATAGGSIIGPDRVFTDSQGIAVVTFKSDKITGVAEQQIPVKATVLDIPKGVYGHDQIVITFLPPTISGVLTKGESHQAVPGATVRVTLDVNNDGKIEPGVDFDQTIVTKADGSYSLPVPEGDREYTLEFTQTVNIGGVETPVTYTQKAAVGNVNGDGNENFDSEETVTGMVLLKKPDGKPSLFNTDLVNKMTVYLKDAHGNYISDGSGKPKGFELQGQGVFNASGLTKGTTYSLEIRYEIEPGQEIVIKRSTVQVTASGEMNISQELVDPYGVITNAVTKEVLPGSKVMLYYADTQRNKDNGKIPNTGVVLPVILGFAPNDNKSPDQLTDATGFYAYFVYPNTDYYLVITKEGFVSKTSDTISVGTDLVQYNAELNPIRRSSGHSSGSSYVPSSPNVTLNLSVDKSLVKEGGQSTITVDYKNQSSSPLAAGVISITLPAGAELVNANGGKVDGRSISWNVNDLAAGQAGSFKVDVKWGLLAAADAQYDIPGQFAVNGNSADSVKADSTVKIKVFSDRFDNLKHQRYILGYPNGKFQPDNSLTRAELAAIVARLTENVKVSDALSYNDINEGHWAANYVKIATKHGYFSGFEDGSFRPEAQVSRGELASVMARFLKLNVSGTGELHFTDTQGHWSGDAIEELYRGKFLSGYPDGTFKPQDSIRRVEAVTMINRMLYRGPVKGIEALFPDVTENHWGFGDVQEATSSHESVRNEDGSETWKNKLVDDVQ